MFSNTARRHAAARKITRRVEFFFESAASRGLPIDHTPQYGRRK